MTACVVEFAIATNRMAPGQPLDIASQGMHSWEASAMRVVARLKIASDRSTPVEPLRNAREITFNYT